uniref:RRM domain-containing protein n=1 Tax=Eptatretus burgeri TaxID=7764 RepID=A0A8C4QG11_EPTBU
MEHLASAFGDSLNIGVADPDVTYSAADQLGLLLSSGSTATMSGGPQQFGSMFGGAGARMELGSMLGGGQWGRSAGIEQLDTMAGIDNHPYAVSRSTSHADSDTNNFSSGSEALADLMPGLNFSDSLYSPAVLSTSIAASREALSSQTRAPASQTMEGVSSLGFGLQGGLRGGEWFPCRVFSPPSLSQLAEPHSIENQAQRHQQLTATDKIPPLWIGKLPPRIYKNPGFSTKVFLGGVPHDITEAGLLDAFHDFGPVLVEWPGKEAKHALQGHAYMVFEFEAGVRALLQHCRPDVAGDDLAASYFYRVVNDYMHFKDVQVIPWLLADSEFDCVPCEPIMEPEWTVFVGALHGKITAEGLSCVFSKLFGGVLHVAMHIDKHKYPIGSARVTFGNRESYLRAIAVAFVDIVTETFTKKIRVAPYLKDSVCQICSKLPGTFFCREMMCFKYFCKFCWFCQHDMKNIHSHPRTDTPTHNRWMPTCRNDVR